MESKHEDLESKLMDTEVEEKELEAESKSRSSQEQEMEGEGQEMVMDEEVDFDNLVSLRVLIQPQNFPHMVDLDRSLMVEEVKERIAEDLQLPPDAMVLEGAGLENSPDLMHLEPGTEYEVKLTIERDMAEAGMEYRLPDQLDVVVHFDDEDMPSKTITVAVVREDAPKRYLGGYRHKKTGAIYHHAETQRDPDRKKESQRKVVVKYTRDTQTAVEVCKTVQTRREHGTQMARPDLYIDDSKDRELEPREYFDSHKLHLLKVKSAIVIQRYWRGYMARTLAEQIRQERRDRMEEQRQLREKRELEEKEQHRREVERRMNPKTKSDFEVLYNELENWRQHETTRIHSTLGLSEKERQKQLEELLHKETKLLQTIDKLKLTASRNNRKEKIDKILKMMAAPKKWQMSDGDITLVHTPFTTRAKELYELYNGLQLIGTTIDERLDILLHVKWTVKEFDCELTRDLVDLIDREADLLNRGRSEKILQGLRKRITTLFLQFVETPEFNPEAGRFQQVPIELIDRPQIAPK